MWKKTNSSKRRLEVGKETKSCKMHVYALSASLLRDRAVQYPGHLLS